MSVPTPTITERSSSTLPPAALTAASTVSIDGTPIVHSKPRMRSPVSVCLPCSAPAEPVALELPVPKDPRARRFAELVTTRPGDARTTAQLARKAGASLRTLERVFLAETGVAVGEWRRRVRLFHAVRLLEAGKSVGAVADEVGYESVSAFSQAFARQFGRSPTGRVRRSP